MAGNYKHGMRYTRIYTIWRSMKQRCRDKNCNRYQNYGARGIKVCEAWNNDFISFYTWAIKNGYSENLTIDRINTDGDYEPSNCRWATQKEQQNNRTNNILLEYKDNIHTISEWAEITGINRKTIWGRVHNGWSVERALTEKPKIRNFA